MRRYFNDFVQFSSTQIVLEALCDCVSVVHIAHPIFVADSIVILATERNDCVLSSLGGQQA